MKDDEGRCYAKTEERLAVGMSGGPVIDEQGKCRGVFQGIIPPATDEIGGEGRVVDPQLRPLQEQWQLHAGYIPAKYILSYDAILEGAKSISQT